MPVDLKMPQLGESVTEGTIGRWLKQPGDAIKLYEPLLEVTTDKVDTEVPSMIDGTLLEIMVGEGETVRVGTLIARLGEAAEAPTSAAAPQPQASNATPSTTHSLADTPSSPPISPVVARLAAEHGLDLSRIKGTGAGGRVSKKDVERYLAQRNQAPAKEAEVAPAPVEVITSPAPGVTESTPALDQALQETMLSAPAQPAEEAAPFTAAPSAPRVERQPEPPALGPDDELVPLSPMRRVIAEHMVRSRRTAPHVTTVMEVDLTRVAAHRERVKNDYERQGARLTYTPYFVQAAVQALQQVPLVNASYSDGGIIMHRRINVGVAVALEEGLLVPVIHDADDKSLLGLARAMNDLSERARIRRLRPDETRGGTFTITNHGISGSLFATPIINQPQAAILGIGAIEKRAVVVSDNGSDAIAIRLRAYLSLTIDHRVMDGAVADQFLQVVKNALETYDQGPI